MSESPDDNADTGWVAGLGAGAIWGARIGSMAIPIPVVGTVAGAVLGGLIGSTIGHRIAPTLTNAYTHITTPSEPGTPELVNSIPRNAIPIVGTMPIGDERERYQHYLDDLRAKGSLSDEAYQAAQARLDQP